LKAIFVAAAGALAVAVLAAAPTQPATAASCKAGYEPVKIQGNWVCRVKTPRLPIKANTQRKKGIWIPIEAPVLRSPDGRRAR
jgi:hypothetical protein